MFWPTLYFMAMTVALMSQTCHSQLTDSEKADALRFSNVLRRSVVPKAGDMNGLLWDDKLEGLAQDAANKCKYQHYYDGPYGGLGENVYKGGRRNMTEILMFMFLERENYDFKTGSCNLNSGSKYPMFTTCGHYLQLVSARITHIGCGLKTCDDGSNLVFCEYNSGYSSPPYEAGEPGTKCQHVFATYTQDDLCYFKSPIAPPPISGPLDCKLTCMNYGNITFNEYQCACKCPGGYYGTRCQQKITTTNSVPNDCKAQQVWCKNGGTPTMSGEVCKCVCPANYRGEECEENIKQMDNSVFWYFGQAMHYSSYYPVDPSVWTTKLIQSTYQYYLTAELNTYCKANYKSCCPNSASATTADNFVAYADFAVTDNYPQNVLDGSLKVGIYYLMPESVAQECGGSSAPYVNRNALLAASAKAMPATKGFLVYMSVKVIKYE